MDSIATFAKENFDLILLAIGALGVIVSVISLVLEVRKRKSKVGD